jgi:heptosyltransferase-2
MALPIPVADPAERWPDGPRRQTSVVVQTSFLGDVVLTTPLIAELAKRGPVDVVVRPDAAPLLAHNPAIRSVIVFDKRSRDRGPLGMWRVATMVRAAGQSGDGPRVAYLAQGSFRSAALAVLAGCPERIGFETSRTARRLYTRVMPFPADRHHAERLWSLAATPFARATPAALRPRLYPGREEERAADGVLGARRLGERLVALAPGSVWATKRWPYYAELAERITRSGARVVVVGGSSDAALAAEIARACPADSVIDGTGRLSLLASAAVLGRCTALVTNDSAPQHLASAMGVPTVTIFGPTVPEFGFGPLAPGSSTVGHAQLACRPCDPHGPKKCPLGHWRCMRELTTDEVDGALGTVAALQRAPS